MSPALRGSSAVQHVECGNVFKVHDSISTRDSHIIITYNLLHNMLPKGKGGANAPLVASNVFLHT